MQPPGLEPNADGELSVKFSSLSGWGKKVQEGLRGSWWEQPR